MTAFELAQLIDPQHRPRPAGDGRYSVRCPSHDDKTPSLSVWFDERGKAAFNCFAGCTHDAIASALNPQAHEACAATWNGRASVVRIAPKGGPTSYEYQHADGSHAYNIVRGPDKKFRLSPPGAEPILYNLPKIIAALGNGDPIWVVEGEKDADTLTAHGLVATTAPFGAGKFGKVDSSLLVGAPELYVIPDNDEPGREHARQVAELTGARIVELPDLPEKGDVTDWLESGHTVEELAALVDIAPPPRFRLSPGSIIFDIPLDPEPIWGSDQDVLWAKGEPLMIYGPTGIGKTTLTGRLILAAIEVDDPEVLGHEIHPLAPDKNVLYVAADRPRQAMRSLRRMVPTVKRDILARRLVIEHERQLWADEGDKEMLYEACLQASAGIVVIDSTKDVASGPLKDEGPSKALMDAIQVCIARGVDVLLLHHPRKGSQDGKKDGPRRLDIDDVYGSTWLTAGCGSVICVDGVAGSGQFTVYQLKSPASFVEQMDVAVNYETGALERRNVRDLVSWMKHHERPVTVRQVAAFLSAVDEASVTDAQRKRAKRSLDLLVTQGRAARDETQASHTYIWTPEATLIVPPPKEEMPNPYE